MHRTKPSVSGDQRVTVTSSKALVAALAETREAHERQIVQLTVYRQKLRGPWRTVADLHLVSGTR